MALIMPSWALLESNPHGIRAGLPLGAAVPVSARCSGPTTANPVSFSGAGRSFERSDPMPEVEMTKTDAAEYLKQCAVLIEAMAQSAQSDPSVKVWLRMTARTVRDLSSAVERDEIVIAQEKATRHG